VVELGVVESLSYETVRNTACVPIN
jgi:hypothetical protein